MSLEDQHAAEYTSEQLRSICDLEYHPNEVAAIRQDKDGGYVLILSAYPSQWMKAKNPTLALPPWDNPLIVLRCKRQTLLDLARQIEYVLQAK